MGTLIVIEGLDGSGKATQTKRLLEKLKTNKTPVKALTFPDYESESSRLVQMYLEGSIGELNQVNIYAATSFYAADRYISYQTKWKDNYLNDEIIIADRYTTSNIIYQMAKLPKNQWDEYIQWLWDYEYRKLTLPEPTKVLYLDVEPEISRKLMYERYSGDESKLDLHERDLEYLLRCREAGHYAAQVLEWEIINSSQEGKILPIELIADKIENSLSFLFD